MISPNYGKHGEHIPSSPTAHRLGEQVRIMAAPGVVARWIVAGIARGLFQLDAFPGMHDIGGQSSREALDPPWVVSGSRSPQDILGSIMNEALGSASRQ